MARTKSRISLAERVPFVIDPDPPGTTLQNVVVTSSDPTVLDVQLNADGLSGFAIASARRGDAAVVVAAQNENGEPLGDQGDVTVTGVPAKGLSVTFGSPAPK